MEREEFAFLLTKKGQRMLDELTAIPITPQNHLSLASRLRRKVTQEQAHALLETALLRQRATEKFSRASEMYFTRPALEQASAEIVSHHRTQRFRAIGVRQVADLACSVGGDSLALAAQATVTGVDLDDVRLIMARENVGVYGHGGNFLPLQADLEQLAPLDVDAFFCDPGRRDERGRRYTSLHEYRPSLFPLLQRWLPRVPHAAVKVSPAIDYAEIPSEAEVEFISLSGDVKEGLLWFGDLRLQLGRQATLLPEGHTLTEADDTGETVAVTKPRAFLYEPDGAVIRAHLVETLAQQLRANKIDDTIAYLTADEAVATPFARCFALDEAMPFHLKQLRHRLRERGVGRVTVKKRGSPIEPETLQRQLRLQGDEEVIVFLTHVQGDPYVLIGREVTPK